MKCSLYFLLLLFSVCSLEAQLAPAHKPIVPLQPPDLIKLLPPTPNGWEMKESKAKSFYNEWLVSQASRQFVQPQPPSSSAGPGGQRPPQITHLRLTDTGFNPALFGDFEQFKAGKYGNTESLSFNAFPARRITFADGERLRILIKARFIVEVETHNQAPNAAMLWAKQFDFSRLNSIPDAGVEKLANPLTVFSIDELNPKANSSYQVSWSTQEDLDAARKRKP
ncbi:MAG: hypothetical protein QOI04_1462 [Verrucomicrobiota bacterium]|jgi:hypothetical protein